MIHMIQGLSERTLSPVGQEAIAQAQAEIDTDKGIVVDDSYFQELKERRAKLRVAR